MFVLIDAKSPTGARVWDHEGRLMRQCLGHTDAINSNDDGDYRLTIPSDNNLARSRTRFVSAGNGGISHTFNDISSRSDKTRIDYILTRQEHRPRAYCMMLKSTPRLCFELGGNSVIIWCARRPASAAVTHLTGA